jgi:hypothetical protein
MSENLNPNENKDELGMGLKILSFCIPLAGGIIYFMKKKDEPKSAQTACYAALIGVGVGIVFQVVAYLMGAGGGY